MKKKILIASFFAAIMLMMHFTAIAESAGSIGSEKSDISPSDGADDPQPSIVTGGDILGWTGQAYGHVSNVYYSLQSLDATIDARQLQIDAIKNAIWEAQSFLESWKGTRCWQVFVRLKILFTTNWQGIFIGIQAAADIIEDWYSFFNTGEYPDIIQALDNLRISCENFRTWYGEAHWNDDIYIYGSVSILLGEGIGGASVSCRGVTVETGDDGSFGFNVSSAGDQYQWWIHPCQVIVSYKEETKQSESIPVFSSGSLESVWLFPESGPESNELESNSKEIISESKKVSSGESRGINNIFSIFRPKNLFSVFNSVFLNTRDLKSDAYNNNLISRIVNKNIFSDPISNDQQIIESETDNTNTQTQTQTTETGQTITFSVTITKYPTTAKVGESKQFKAYAPNAVSYNWDFDDGHTGTGASVYHTYNKADTYTVKVTATDTSGNTGDDQTTITVNPSGSLLSPISSTQSGQSGSLSGL